MSKKFKHYDIYIYMCIYCYLVKVYFLRLRPRSVASRAVFYACFARVFCCACSTAHPLSQRADDSRIQALRVFVGVFGACIEDLNVLLLELIELAVCLIRCCPVREALEGPVLCLRRLAARGSLILVARFGSDSLDLRVLGGALGVSGGRGCG